MTDLVFAQPQWVHALWIVLALGAGLLWLERRAGDALSLLVSRTLQKRLVQATSRSQRAWRVGLLTLALVCGVIALMRPQWGAEFLETPRASAELMICLDVSRSMLAEDVAPNRLERAKAEIRDLLTYLEGDHVGLIAFAGRASVLAPMTPDFGHLRLVLDGLGPHSVTRGGTRLEEPLRKAIAGFRVAGDVSRSILLITDGEDHDSFPLEAAKAAAEKGVSVIAIGFGSESGSEIPITDPKTGARTLVRGADGRAVVTRLDGDTLREIALLTEGAYVPAGTGVLDLESIYDRHLRGLLRGKLDGRGRVARREGFQYAVLASLVFLLASVGIGHAPAGTLGGGPTALALLLSLAIAAPLRAQEPDAADVPEAGAPSEATIPPREVYNGALAILEAGRRAEADLEAEDVEAAARGLEAARDSAATDGELRYRATHRLGWVAAARADTLLASEPERALEELGRAADWYREAIRLRADADDARLGLEVVLQRALVLADSLREADDAALEARLDGLIETQRGLVAALRGLLENSRSDPDREGSEPLRQAFRSLSTEQRATLSDADILAGDVDAERRGLEAAPDAEAAPEQEIRGAQLDQLLHYLHRGRERMGQARRELRQRRSERAYRRGAAALTELKRARDQLAEPLQVLDALIRDAAELSGMTQLHAALARGSAALSSGQERVEPPPWLTPEYLRETQEGVEQRSQELHARLASGSEALAAEEAQAAQGDPERERFLLRLRQAIPLLADASAAFVRALDALAADASAVAVPEQADAIASLVRARELFLELRGLIEAAYADQTRLGQVLTPDPEMQIPAATLEELYPAMRELQGTNLARAERIDLLIADELVRVPPEGAAGDPGAEEQAKAERARLEAARRVLGEVESAMRGLHMGLPDPAAKPPAAVDAEALAGTQTRAIEGLQMLRRLFFSVVEHLRETAGRQQQLNDETADVAALGIDPNAPSRLDPLIPRQKTLGETSTGIAEALEEQSRRPPIDPGEPASDPAAAEQEADRLRRAAELVIGAADSMAAAVTDLEGAPPALDESRADQDEALDGLLEALALLSPPPEEQEQEQEQEQDSGSGEEPEPQAAEAGSQEQEDENAADPGQLLQAVQDREAQRRAERSRRGRQGYDTVDKDW